MPARLTSFVVTLLALLPSFVTARETILEDVPSRLVLEVEVDDYFANASVAAGSATQRITSAAYGGPSEPGAPDLPVLRFQVATGDRLPRVSVEPLEWIEVSVPGGLAGVPRWVTTRQAEPARDEALFTAARGLNAAVSNLQVMRGLGLRTVSLPLGTYAGGTSVRMLKKFRVRVEFPNPAVSPSPGMKSWLEFAGVKNTHGGSYLVAAPRTRSQALARAATITGTAAFDSLAPRLRITIGDRVLDAFDEDGVYALTYAQARAAGMPAGPAVARLRLFAGPNDTLGIRMDSLVAPTLREIPIEVRDVGGDNTFDDGDTLLFYGRGTSIWVPIAGATGPVRWEFKNDPWSFENRYYLQWNGPETGALRIPTASPLVTADTAVTTPHYLRGERDLMTGSCDPAGLWDGETGHVWHWFRKFHCAYTNAPGFGPLNPVFPWSQLRRPHTDSLPGRVTDTIRFGFFTFQGPRNQNFEPWSGPSGTPLAFVPDSQVAGAWYVNVAAGSGNGVGLDSVRWSGPFPRFEGYTIRYTRSLRYRDADNVVFPARSGAPVAYKVEGAPAGLRVLRVESGIGARWLAVSQAGGVARFADLAADGENVRYQLVGPAPLVPASGALTIDAPPTAAGVIQGLRDGSIGGARRNPEYLIIAPQALLAEAVQLAEYRNDPAFGRAWVTSVVRVEDIYREWSGGRMSPVAIRDFLRWALNRWGAGNSMGNLKHVLLFGDGHYDYRNIVNATSGGSPNHIPPFNWQASDLDPNPMSTDDFYAVLDSGAVWNTSLPSISIGRLPAKNTAQAADYFKKVSVYESPAASGEWRGRFLLTADDATQRNRPGGIDPIPHHTYQSEQLGNRILAQDSGLRKETIYLFDYDHNASYLKPAATQDLLNQVNRGVLFSTFYGHGAYNQMADEVLLKTGDGLARFRNEDKCFMMTIFSCTVGRFDKLADEGLSEQFLMMKGGGAIATLSATRESYDGPNEALGHSFTTSAFSKTADSNTYVMGDAIRLAKVQVGMGSSINSAKYVLLGEPVVGMRRPGLGLELTQRPDSLKALGCGTVSGRVTKGSGRGAVSIRIVSGDVRKDYPYSNPVFGKPNIVFKRGQILFETKVSYTDSTFTIPYFLPKQVPFGDTAAKIQIFAWDSLELRESALLVGDLKISGTDSSTCMVDDKRGPRISVTGCNTAETGGADFPDKVKIGLPYCLQVSVSDSGGGVLAGEGPDQATTVEVVGSIAPYQPQAGVDELYGKSYQVPLSPQELAPGTHLLKVSARDGFGNRTQRQISLQVSADTALHFVRAFNTPNPLKSGKTTFWFTTSLPVEEGADQTSVNVDRVRFHLKIFNQLGYMVREFREARSGETQWDGRDAWGRQLANGVYFFEVTATWDETNGSPAGGRSTSKKNVLVISR